jgi:hypothetical protein
VCDILYGDFFFLLFEFVSFSGYSMHSKGKNVRGLIFTTSLHKVLKTIKAISGIYKKLTKYFVAKN